jgi:hypothetical protein
LVPKTFFEFSVLTKFSKTFHSRVLNLAK